MSNEKKNVQQSVDAKTWQDRRSEHETRVRELIKDQFGDEALSSITTSTYQITITLMEGLLRTKNNAGETDKFLSMIHDFGNALGARLDSVNLNPDAATTALEGATALMTPEPLQNFKPGAQNLVSALKSRYSIADK